MDTCRSLLAERPAARETARCFYRLATGDGSPGLLDEAISTLEELGAEHRPWFAFYTGHLAWSDADVAEALYQQAAEGFAQDGSLQGEILARINRSQLLTRTGRAAEARSEVVRIFDLTDATDDPELKAWGQIVLARELVERGEDIARAHGLLRDVQVPSNAKDAFSLHKDRLVYLGRAAIELGRLREAQQAFREVVEIARRAGNRHMEANGRYNLAWVAYQELRAAPTPDARAEAVRLAEEALGVASEVEHPSEILSAWLLGALTPGAGGIPYLERCFRLAESPTVASNCLNSMAVRLAADSPDEAQRLLADSGELARDSREGFAELRLWQARMRVDWATRSPEQALASSRDALQAIEALRDRQPAGSAAQAGLFSLWSDDYAWLSGRLLEEAGRGLERGSALREAFRVSERRRARALLSWLRRTEPDAATGAESEFVGLDEVRRALAPDEALLSFQVAPWEDVAGDFGGGSWLLAVTRDGVSVHRLPDRVEIRRSVQLFEGLIDRRDGSERVPGTHLHRKLLGRALAGLPAAVDRLILVPDDALHTLAFAALRAAPEADPLGQRFELVRAPSATFWLRWLGSGSRRERSPPDPPVLVLADPELPPGDEEAEGPVQVAEVRGLGDELGRLRHARREGRAAVRALGDGVLLSGAEASEAALAKFDLRGVGLLHFAAHAVSDEDRPERSAILLAAGGDGYDGLLQSAEIAALELGGSAVILASCRSGSGTVLRGEGVMSLGRAFFQAGAHSVVASLWPLRDDESAVQFRRFYRHLAGGGTVAEALAGARREAITRGEPAAAWAGLVLLGHGDLTPVPDPGSGGPEPPFILLVAAGALLLAGALVLALRLRWRRAITTDRRR